MSEEKDHLERRLQGLRKELIQELETTRLRLARLTKLAQDLGIQESPGEELRETRPPQTLKYGEIKYKVLSLLAIRRRTRKELRQLTGLDPKVVDRVLSTTKGLVASTGATCSKTGYVFYNLTDQGHRNLDRLRKVFE